jgi:CRP/FNR family transcriptional regulator, anaerobic regulatory protein
MDRDLNWGDFAYRDHRFELFATPLFSQCCTGIIKLPDSDKKIRDANTAAADAACQQCGLHKLCFPQALPDAYLALLPMAGDQRIRLARGDYLFRAGDMQTGIYAVKAGFLKTCVSLADGQSRIIGFQKMGDVLGLNGLGTGAHKTDAIALNGCEVCAIPIDKFDALLQHPVESTYLRQLLARELTRTEKQAVMGRLSAKQRVAAFLLEMSESWEHRGYSKNVFVLFMSRQDIGNFLGLTFETVSRTLSYFQSKHWIKVQGRSLRIQDIKALQSQLASAV